MRQDNNKPQKSTSNTWMLMIVLHMSILLALLFFSIPAKKVLPANSIETEIKTSRVEVQKPTA